MALLNKRDVIDMMKRSREEIIALRSQVESLAPKAHAYDQLSLVLSLLPRQPQGYGEDVAHRLARQIEEEEAALKVASTGTTEP
jgi:hypothetical protein